jgi:hypothetical protein
MYSEDHEPVLPAASVACTANECVVVLATLTTIGLVHAKLPLERLLLVASALSMPSTMHAYVHDTSEEGQLHSKVAVLPAENCDLADGELVTVASGAAVSMTKVYDCVFTF